MAAPVTHPEDGKIHRKEVRTGAPTPIVSRLPRSLITFAGLGVLVAVAFLVGVRDHNTTSLYTLVRYDPPVCTQTITHPECGRATIEARSSSGALRSFYYAGNEMPEVGLSGHALAQFYAPGSQLRITTSGSSDHVLRVRRVSGPTR
jgi:hypothetical protein